MSSVASNIEVAVRDDTVVAKYETMTTIQLMENARRALQCAARAYLPGSE